MNYSIIMQNTTTKEVYTFNLENQNYSENIYYKFDITLQEGMRDGEYQYILFTNPNKFQVIVDVNNPFRSELYGNPVILVTYNNTLTNGTQILVAGNDVKCNAPGFEVVVNKKGETIVDIMRKITIDKMIFGGYAIQVIRDMIGRVAEIYHIDFMNIRSSEKNDILYYATDWTAWSVKAIKYPKFGVGDENPASIFYNKGYITRGVYPIPVYGAAILSCETEKNINEFHLNNINNGFMGNLIINFNNGEPTDEIREEIERNINEKFSGYQNAGRILISYNADEANKTTIERLDSDDFDEKYQSLSERTREQIFCAFRANPNLFGINSDSTGFNEQEFESSFKLYNRTMIRPIQKEICDSFDKIFGMQNSITISPFSLNEADTKQVE